MNIFLQELHRKYWHGVAAEAIVTLRTDNVTVVKQRDPYINIKWVEGKTQMVTAKTSILISKFSGWDDT